MNPPFWSGSAPTFFFNLPRSHVFVNGPTSSSLCKTFSGRCGDSSARPTSSRSLGRFDRGDRDINGESIQPIGGYGLNRLYGGFHQWGYPKKCLVEKLRMENPIKMDDSGVPLFQETTIWLSMDYMVINGYGGISIWIRLDQLGIE